MNYWAVGSSFGGTDDKTQEFIDSKNWFDGKYENGHFVNQPYLERINEGDVLVMKSSATKGKGNKITFTKVKSIGIITKKIDTHKFKVDWLSNKEFPKDFDGLSYRKTIEPLRDDLIRKFVINQLQKNENMEITALLKHKKQIILQGPPGTGKTRLAKQIAEYLTKEVKTLNPLDKINAFFQKNKNSQNSIAKTEADKKLTHFNQAYPKENLKEISIEEYAIGTGENNTFCWWMEIGLKSLGYYFPGNSNTYRIYWSKKQDSYIISGNLLKDKEEDEAFLTLKEHLFKLVNDKDYLAGKEVFTESFMLKILHSYYPEEYFPVNSDNCMNNILKLLNIPNHKLDRLEKNKKIQDFFNSKKEAHKTNVSSYDFMGFLFEEFDLKGIINFEGSEVIEKGAFKIIQFHPSYTYEDFVRGISVKSNASETVEYKTENRVLAEFAEMALNNKSSNYVLIIDEINRANLSSVLGELIYALEYRGESVDSMYDIDGDRKIILPPNLFIIGTMNTADRSVGQIDYAIRRRFAFVDVLPEVLNETELNNAKEEKTPQLYFEKDTFLKVQNLFKTVTEDKTEKKSEYLSEEFEPKDVQLGHSYFIYTEGNFNYNLKYEIKPILKEYVRDGILKTSALTIIDAL